MTSNPKRTASDRSLYKKGKEEKRRAYKMMRNIANTDRTSKDHDIRGTGGNDWKQTMEQNVIKYNYKGLIFR